MEAFRGFFIQRIAERGEYCIFISPFTLEEDALDFAQNPFKIRYWATSGVKPNLNNKVRVLGKLFPECAEDSEEVFDLNKVEFEKIEIVKRIELNNPTTAWNF